MLVAFAARAADAPSPAPAVPATAPAPSGVAGYLIGPGDVLQITVYGEPGLSGSFPVSDAGQVDFPLLGPFPVVGKAAPAVAASLRASLTPGYLVNPNVTVSVTTYHSQPVQVLGAVARPGVYYLHGPSTVLTLLSEAGGVTRDGVNEVRLSHGGGTTDSKSFAYDAMLKQEVGDPEVTAGDVIFVPQSLVSVMGSVGKPGEIAWREGLTVANCVAAAGGALPVADLGRVVLLHDGVRTRVNLRKILSGKLEDVPVEPGDKVYVEESAI